MLSGSSFRKVVDGVVYDMEAADVIFWRDKVSGRHILAITPEGHYFSACISQGLLLSNWYVIPHTRFTAVWWLLRNDGTDDALKRLGVEVMPSPNVPADKPYEDLRHCEIICARKKLFTNWFIHTCEFFCKNPGGRYFVYEGMMLLGRFLFEEHRPISPREALLYGIKHMATWYDLEQLGYVRTEEERERYKSGA